MKNYQLGLILLIKLLLELINMCGICIEMKKLIRNVITIYVVLMLSLRGFMKIHKSSVPLRPIVSFVNSPTYNLSKFLSRVLSSLLKNNYSVRNSREFLECIKNYSVEENECLVSFDVVSLLHLCRWTRLLPSCWNFSHLMILCLLVHVSVSLTSNKVSKYVWIPLFFHTKSLFSSKPLVLPWVIAFLPSLLIFTWNTLNTQLSLRFILLPTFG